MITEAIGQSRIRVQIGLSAKRVAGMVAEKPDIGHHVVELGVGDYTGGEPGHGAKAMTNLEAHEKRRDALIVERGADARCATDVALIAVLHEHALALGEARVSAELLGGDDIGVARGRRTSGNNSCDDHGRGGR